MTFEIKFGSMGKPGSKVTVEFPLDVLSLCLALEQAPQVEVYRVKGPLSTMTSPFAFGWSPTLFNKWVSST
jgi:hypothetical protein